MKHIAVLSTLLFVGCSNSDSINEVSVPSNNLENPVVETVDPTENILDEPENQASDTTKRYNIMEYCELIHGNDSMLFGVDFEHTRWEVKDIANGYLKFYGMMEGDNTMVLYRMKNGNALILETVTSCGPACDQSLYMIQYDGLSKVGDANHLLPLKTIQSQLSTTGEDMLQNFADLNPDEYEPEAWFHLPQKGTDLKITCEIEREGIACPLMVLAWDGEQFTVKQAIDEYNGTSDAMTNFMNN